MTPTTEQLRTWLKRWTSIKKEVYAELVASYTPEQRAIIQRMNQAGRNVNLCKRRLTFPAGVHGDREERVAWPEEPPA